MHKPLLLLGRSPEARARRPGDALLVALAAADPRRLGNALVLLAGLALRGLGVERLVAIDGDRLLDVAFHGLEKAALLGGDEGDRRAALAGAGRAADAVHVALGLDRELHVHDEVDVGNVNAAARDIRRHQHARLAFLEGLESARTLVLRFVGVDGGDGDLLLAQLALYAVGAVARPGEDDHAIPFRMVLEQMDEQIVLVPLVHEHALLVDALDGGRLGGDHDLHGVVHKFAGELEDFGRKRRREEKRLAGFAIHAVATRAGRDLVRGELRDDALDVRQEPHVQHAVRFVKHEELHLVEEHHALRHEVNEAARGRDDRLGALLERLDLRELGYAPKDPRKRKPFVLRVLGDVLGGLRGQFARWRKDKRTGMACRTGLIDLRRGGLQQTVQDRQHERRSLTSACLGTADEITALKQEGDRLFLDRRGDRIADFADGVLETSVELAEDIRLIDGRGRILRQLGHLHLFMFGKPGMAIVAAASAVPPLASIEERGLAAPEVLAANWIVKLAHDVR